MAARVDEYKGHPVLVFGEGGDKFPITLGISKLIAVVENIEAVLDFLSKNGGQKGADAIAKFEQDAANLV